MKKPSIQTVVAVAVSALLVTGAVLGFGALSNATAPQPVAEVAAEQEPDNITPAVDGVNDLAETTEQALIAAKTQADADAARVAAEAAAAQAAADAAAAQAAADAAAKAKQKTQPPAASGPTKCPAGSSANSGDGLNDTSCFPDICFHITLPDPAHPECVTAFKP